MQNRTSIVVVFEVIEDEGSFRLVKNRTSIVGNEVYLEKVRGFRPVQNRTSNSSQQQT